MFGTLPVPHSSHTDQAATDYTMFGLLLSIVLITTATISTATSSNHVYCVSSRNETHPCPPPCELCHPLSYYTSSITQYFTSNTIIKFLPGVHDLEDNTTVLIENIHQLELVGETSGDQDTIVQCDSITDQEVSFL